MSGRPTPRWIAALALVCSALWLVGCALVGSARADGPSGGSAAPSAVPSLGTTTTDPPPAPFPLPGIYGSLIGGGSISPPSDTKPFGSENSDPSWWDVPGQIEKAIDTWFGNLVKSAPQPVPHLIASALLSSPDMSSSRIAKIWTGVVITANSIYVLFVLAGGVIVMGHETVSTRGSLKEIAPQLVTGIIPSNASLWLICQSASRGNALSAAHVNGDVSAEEIGSRLTSTVVEKRDRRRAGSDRGRHPRDPRRSPRSDRSCQQQSVGRVDVPPSK